MKKFKSIMRLFGWTGAALGLTAGGYYVGAKIGSVICDLIFDTDNE